MDKKKLALIHIIKKELKLSDKEYRNILWEAAAVRSAKDLDEFKFKKLMRYFVRSPYYRLNPYGLTIRQKLFIKYLAEQLGWSSQHLNNFMHKYYHKPDLDNLTKKEAIKAIVALENIKQHRSRKTEG